MALPQLSVDQMKALPETVAFPIERFLLGERADLLPRVASQNHLSSYRCSSLEAPAKGVEDLSGLHP